MGLEEAPRSLDRPLNAGLRDLSNENWKEKEHTITLQLKYLDKLPYYNFKEMPYFEKVFPGAANRDFIRVNEHLAILMCLVANSIVIAVFVRVLGLARLPSRVIVSLALVNILIAISITFQTTSVNVLSLSNSVGDCRFVTQLLHQSFMLHCNTVSAAIIERTLACNMPAYYNHNLTLIESVVLVTPWAFWALNVVLTTMQTFKFDMGYECASYLNSLVPHHSMHAGVDSAVILEVLLLTILGITMILRNQNSGDVWEINRMQFELRTTVVIVRVAVLTLLFSLVVILGSVKLTLEGFSYDEYRRIHITYQVAIHQGLCLIMVLLTRQEFRKHLPLMFESKETIMRVRTTNLLVSQATRGYSSRLKRKSDQDKSRDFSESEGPSASRNRQISSITAQSAATPDSGQLVSRDKVLSVQTPDWLKKKKEVKTFWPIPRALASWFPAPPDSDPSSDSWDG